MACLVTSLIRTTMPSEHLPVNLSSPNCRCATGTELSGRRDAPGTCALFTPRCVARAAKSRLPVANSVRAKVFAVKRRATNFLQMMDVRRCCLSKARAVKMPACTRTLLNLSAHLHGSSIKTHGRTKNTQTLFVAHTYMFRPDINYYCAVSGVLAFERY